MEWLIGEENQLTPQDIDRQGIKFLTGNGNIGYRGTLEEFNKEQKAATTVNGLYDKVGNKWREPINLPNGCWVQVFHNNQLLHVLSSKIVFHSQNLDIYNAVHNRQTIFESADGTQITIHARRFVSLARRQLICMEYSVSADHDCAISIHAGIDGDVWDINGPHLRRIVASEKDGILSVCAVTSENSVPVAVSEAVTFPTTNPKYELATLENEKPNCTPVIYCDIRVTLEKNTFTFFKFVSHVTGQETPLALEASREICQQAAALGFEVLLAEHTALWQKRWANCDIQIEGDPNAQEALRFSLYQLLTMVPTHTARTSIPARGISGQMYKGAIFWDTEIFILPFFNHTFPAYTRNLLLYRYHSLDGARRKAKEYGFRGAFYAWESQDNGNDACTLFNITDVFTNRPMRTYFRDKQVHISADVAYAFWRYYTSTNDESIWRDGGAEVVFECARFFLSYSYFSPDKHRYEILDVTGPDEYHERVNNNAFTNRLVAHTFEICLAVADLLRRKALDTYENLMRALDFEQDLVLIGELARSIFLPDAVPAGTLIPQFDGYFSLEDVPLQTLLKNKLHPNEYLGGGNGLATTTQIIKQADVVLILFLFSERYPIETKAANWNYYEPRTEHGSSLSACSYSLIAAELGKVEWAYKYFLKTANVDLSGEGKQYVGPLYIGGTHAASCGGAWMSAVFGMCGIHFSGETVAINPHLPAHWNKVTLPFVVRGLSLKITLTHESIILKSETPINEPLLITSGETTYPLNSMDELVITKQHAGN